MPAALEPLKIWTHPRRSPAWVAGQISNVIPVRVMRVDQDHGIMRSASPQSTGARIEDAVARRLVVRVAPLLLFILVVPDEKIPFDGGVFGSESMKRRYVVVRWKAIGLGADRIAAAQLPRVTSGFQHNDAATRLSQARGHSPATRTRTYDDVFTIRRRRSSQILRPPLHNQAKNTGRPLICQSQASAPC